MPLQEINISTTQAKNACAIRTLDALGFFYCHQTTDAILAQQKKLQDLAQQAETEFQNIVRQMNSATTSAGGASGLSLERARDCVNLRDSSSLWITITQHTYSVQFPRPKNQKDVNMELQGYLNAIPELEPDDLIAFLKSHNVELQESEIEEVVANCCSNQQNQAYVRLLEKIQTASKHTPVDNAEDVMKRCQDWINSQSEGYPKHFSVLGNFHYCALTVFNEKGECALFNSNTGKIYLGPLTEIINELKRLLTDRFVLQTITFKSKSPEKNSNAKNNTNDDGGNPPSSGPSIGPNGNSNNKPTTPPTPTPVDPKRLALIKSLEKYIQRIESHTKKDGTPDFERFKFPLFRKSRGLNRQLNYMLARQLSATLKTEPETPLKNLIDKEKISTTRTTISLANRSLFNKQNGFTDRGINSSELNVALAAARQP